MKYMESASGGGNGGNGGNGGDGQKDKENGAFAYSMAGIAAALTAIAF